MIRRFARHLPMAVALVLLWLLLWGEVSVPNVASGALVAALLLGAFPLASGRAGRAGRGALRPLGLARLASSFLGQLVLSNVQLTRSILSRERGAASSIVVCPLAGRSERVLTLTANLLALTPGIMPVDIQTDPCTITVHALRAGAAEVRASVAHLERLVIAAVGERSEPAPPGEGSP